MKKQYIGTSEFIVLHGDAAQPEAYFYVREFAEDGRPARGGSVRNAAEMRPAHDGWEARLDNGKSKFFSNKYLKTIFID